ncbi:hypothetical protein QYF36_020339 [Acer negundo]|nr:hypothetical protein QYF36_020339 [Acer negundo]
MKYRLEFGTGEDTVIGARARVGVDESEEGVEVGEAISGGKGADHEEVSGVVVAERVESGSPSEDLEVVVGELRVVVELRFEKVEECEGSDLVLVRSYGDRVVAGGFGSGIGGGGGDGDLLGLRIGGSFIFNMASSMEGLVSPMRTCGLRSTSISKLTKMFASSSFNVPSPSLSKTSRLSIRCAVSFRPCIDIHKGKVKQIVGSTLWDSKEDEIKLVTNFESDKSAAEFADLYKEDGLTGGHAIMLGADSLSQAAAIEALHAYPGGLQVGGGINSENSLSYIEEGASHVIVTSYVFNNGQMDLERLKALVRVVGKQRLVLDLSCRKKDGKYAIVTDRWQKFSDVFLDERVLDFLASYADEFLVHGVDVEGKKLGIDEELVTLLGMHSPIPVTYAGGVTTMADLEKIKVAGMGRVDVTVGSALDIFGGNLPYKDVLAWHQSHYDEALSV